MKNRIEILQEVLKKYKKDPNRFEWWLEDQINPSNILPALQVGEIVWYFCSACGERYLNRNIIQQSGGSIDDNGYIVATKIVSKDKCNCGCNLYFNFGTVQGDIWKKKTFYRK